MCVRTPFELEWTDSEMAEDSWRWDQMRNRTPLSPLPIEMGDLVLESLVREAGAVGQYERPYRPGRGPD